VVSIDGFRADHLDRNLTPTLAAIAREGVRAKAMRAKEDYDQWLASAKAKSR
jgi:predicted AlkP superfamily pyrophosphatase or phosphodiesterase